MVRYETDGYIDKNITRKAEIENDNLASIMQSLSLGSISAASADSKLIESTLEIKTRVFNTPIDKQEVLPQTWVSQTPNLVRACHERGLFEPPKVENIASDIKKWEQDHQQDLKSLAACITR